MRSLTDLERAERRGELPEFLFFWGHRPHRDHETGPWCLSQWWPSPFSVEDINFPTAEHYMMSEKARLFGDEDTFRRILSTTDPRRAKSFGRRVHDFDDRIWVELRYDIVVRANLHKFRQNPVLRAYLCRTAGRVLVEASPVDTVWGIGRDARDTRATVPSEWRGTNLLGFALMDVRSTLCGDQPSSGSC